MYSLSSLLVIALTALAAGLIVGALLGARRSPAQRAKDLEKELTTLQQQQEDYQHRVTEHFAETAQLLDQLTSSYRNVHNHLAKGAQSLCDGDAIGEAIQRLPGHDDDHVPDPSSLMDTLSPPLDYAPRTDPAAKGVLDEEFGLEKASDGFRRTGSSDA